MSWHVERSREQSRSSGSSGPADARWFPWGDSSHFAATKSLFVLMGVGVALTKQSSDPTEPPAMKPLQTLLAERLGSPLRTWGGDVACPEPWSFLPCRDNFSLMDLSLIFTDGLQSNWFFGSSQLAPLIIHILRPEPQMWPYFSFSSLPISRPQTSHGHSISQNYLEFEHFSPSLLLPLGSHHPPFCSGPLQLPCARASPRRLTRHMAAKAFLACTWRSNCIASLLKAPWLSSAYCI